jgi:hypothetical protein
MAFSKAGITVKNRVSYVRYLMIQYVRSCEGSVYVMSNLFLLYLVAYLILEFKSVDFWEHEDV